MTESVHNCSLILTLLIAMGSQDIADITGLLLLMCQAKISLVVESQRDRVNFCFI